MLVFRSPSGATIGYAISLAAFRSSLVTVSMTSHPSSTSRSLLAGVRHQDPAAWNRLVDLYAPYVLQWCRRFQLKDEDAADVFQEVFQTVSVKISQFRKSRPGDTFRGWLRTITRNKVHDLYRRRQHEWEAAGGTAVQLQMAGIAADDESLSARLDPAEVTSPEPTPEALLFQRALAQIRDHLQKNTWDAFWRTTVDGRPATEVAAELGMSPGAVRVAKSRVLHRLRRELGDLDE